MEKLTFKRFKDAERCPFCGSDDVVIKSEYFGHLFTPYCHNCFAAGPGKPTEDEARAFWNRRANT